MEWDEYFIGFASWAAKRSTCLRKQVGSVIVKKNRIISTGYNGVSSKAKHCTIHFKELFDTKYKNIFASFEDYLKSDLFYKEHNVFSTKYEIHAEVNALAFALSETRGCELFVTLSPCCHCSKLIIAHGITRVIYLQKYDRDVEGIETLKNNGVIVEQYLEYKSEK